jgi:hypothetical protein
MVSVTGPFISLPATSLSHDQQVQVVSLMNESHKQFQCLSSYNQQSVSDMQFLPVTSLHMPNRL